MAALAKPAISGHETARSNRILSTQRSPAKGSISKGCGPAEDKLKLGSEMALLLTLVVLSGFVATGLLALLFLK